MLKSLNDKGVCIISLKNGQEFTSVGHLEFHFREGKLPEQGQKFT